MLTFNIEFIKQRVPTAIFKRAEIIHKCRFLKLINMEKNNIDLKKKMLTIFFQVASSQSDEEYEIKIDFYFNDNEVYLQNKYCECMYFKSYHEKCKHIVACLLYCYYESQGKLLDWAGLSNQNNDLDINENDLISFFKEQYKQEDYQIEKTIMCNVEIEFESRSKAKLKLQVGTNKLVLVKDIFEFIDLITKSNPTVFDKRRFLNKYNFPLNFEEQNIEYKLQKVISFLSEEFEIFNTSEPGKDNINLYQFIKNSEFRLLAIQTERFLKALQGETIDLTINGVFHSNILISEENYEANLTINLINNKVFIKNEKENPLFLTSKLQSAFEDKKIIFFKKEQKNTSNYILQTMFSQKKKEISFHEKTTQDVVQYIILALTKTNNNITIDPIITNSVVTAELVIESFFDFDGTYVILKPLFRYDDITFDINNVIDGPYKIVMRDYNLEQKYLTFISLLSFEKMNDELKLCDLEAIIQLVFDFLPKLELQSTIYYTDRFKNVRLIKFKFKNANVSVSEGSQLLDFNFELESINVQELKALFMSIKHDKRYHRLQDGGIVDLQNKALTNFINLAHKLDVPLQDLEEGKLLIPKYHALFLDEHLSAIEDINFSKNKYFTDLLTKIKNFDDNDITISNLVNATMRDYQIKGHQWLKTLASLGFGGILADEMGLGKTLQTISYITKEYELEPQMKPVVIIAPASIIYNWKNEFTRFAPHLKIMVVAGSKAARKEILKHYKEFEVLITSYPLMRRDFIEYEPLSFSTCFIDEAQHIKNQNSLNAKVIKGINAPIKFALTGTPIENNLSELWSIFDFILPGFLLSHHKFQRQYEIPIIRTEDKSLLQELTKKTQPFILRRLKKDVALELPDKIENKIIIEMTSRQKKFYAAYAMAARKELEYTISEKGFNKSKIQFLTTLMRLRQICCDPSILNQDYENESAKIDTLSDMLEELIGLGHKILIFSQFTKVLTKIEPILKRLKIKYLYLDGKTPVESRIEITDEFNNKPEISVFLISLKAGGTGLNLTAADVVIHFDPWWNPSIENQATDRAHRIGQKKLCK